jgi:CDGSH iron-sulfur domain-containing protein 3
MTDGSNILIMQIDGPNLVTGRLAVVTPARVRAMQSAMLCRCGHSRDKPFCDGAHVRSGFKQPAQLPAETVSELLGTGSLTIRPIANGPNRCEGPLTVLGSDGRSASSTLTFLCRCGESQRRPYCDGTHKKIGFRE